MTNILTYEEASEIYTIINNNLDRTDEDIVDLYERMISHAVRYAHIRAEWTTLSTEKKMKTDADRTSAHDAFISSINGVARSQGEIGDAWRQRLSDDRKRVGDFACYIALFLGLYAR